MIDEILRQISIWINFLLEKLLEWMAGILGAIFQKLDTFFSELLTWIANTLNSIFISLKTLLDKILASVVTLLQQIEEVFLGLWKKLEELTVMVLDSIRSFIIKIGDEIRGIAIAVIDQVTRWIEDVARQIQRLVDKVINYVGDLYTQVRDSIKGAVDALLVAIGEAWDFLVQRILASYEKLLSGPESLLAGLQERLGGLREAFGEAATDLTAALAGIGEEFLEPIRKAIDSFFAEFVEFVDPRETQAITGAMKKITSGEASPKEMRDFISSEWARYVPESKLWSTTFSIVGSLIGIMMTFLTIGQAQAQILTQDFVKQYPYQILQPADVTLAFRKGLVNETYAVDTIQRQGFTKHDAQNILKLAEIVPPEQDLFALWHRDLVDEKSIDAALRQKGYDYQYTEALKAASYIIPPVGDLIIMAVREAFSPEIAKRFGQYEDFPPDFAMWAEKMGLSKEWSKRYWAAHWALPSPQQGFEMLHRGVVGKPDLELLLRALDVMPFWRDKLTEIAYRPYSRVDVRRMHKLAVLDDAAVLRAYLDLGYSPDRAEKMKDFTILYNEPKGTEDTEELDKLSRASVLNFFTDGLLTQNKAQELLVGMGYSAPGAALFIEYAGMQEERKERKSESALILDLAKADVITYDEAGDRLSALGLATGEIQRAMAALHRHEAAKTKLPTRAEAEKMVLAKLITVDDYRKLLTTFGYQSRWIEAYVALLGGKALASAKPE